jgi:hypothetical protein
MTLATLMAILAQVQEHGNALVRIVDSEGRTIDVESVSLDYRGPYSPEIVIRGET